MTIDERLDRLTERHEALAQHLELSSQMAEHERREIRELFSVVLESVKRLENIALIHEHRITKLENSQL